MHRYTTQPRDEGCGHFPNLVSLRLRQQRVRSDGPYQAGQALRRAISYLWTNSERPSSRGWPQSPTPQSPAFPRACCPLTLVPWITHLLSHHSVCTQVSSIRRLFPGQASTLSWSCPPAGRRDVFRRVRLSDPSHLVSCHLQGHQLSQTNWGSTNGLSVLLNTGLKP